MASNTKDSNLFGEDSDDSSDDDSATPAKQDDAAAPAADDNDGEKTAKDNDSDDSDEDVKEKEPAAAATANKNSALFGDEDSSSEDEGEFKGDDDGIVGKAGGNAKAPVVGRSMNEKLGLESDSDDDHKPTKPKEEAPRKYVPPRKMELLDLPGTNNKNANNKKNNKHEIIHHITKLPNLVGIQPKPYNANTHDMEKEEEEYKGSVHNMIRWRYKTDSKGEYVRDESGNPIKESNARFVKWSDGSYTLHVGREVLEVDNLDSSVPKDSADETRAGFADINGYLYVSQKAKIRPPNQKEIDGPIAEGESDDEDDDNAAPAKPAGTVLECIGQIASRLALRPSSLSSDAHRNLKLAVQKRNVKRARIAEIVTEFDPELQKQARIKGKDDLAKSRARSAGGRRSGGGGGGGGYRRKTGMNERYLEEEEDYDGVNLSRLKRRTMRRDEYSEEDDEIMDYGEDSEEEEEDEWDKKKKRKRGAAASARAAKKAVESEEEEDESGEDGEVVFGDDDDEEDDNVNLAKKHNRGGGTKKTVFGDDDDD